MLNGIRVLEISSLNTMLAGSILADLGAEVVVLEPPGGAPGRRMEPFLDGLPGLERSLTWQALNRNKLGITLALETPDGLDLLRSLVGRFDVLVEATETASTPSWGETIGVTGRLIHTVVRPFFPGGPKGNYKSTDLVLMAASGSLGMMGDPDRPPVPMPVPQAMMEAGGEAAIAVLAAICARDAYGVPQDSTVLGRLATMVSAFSSPISIGSGNSESARSAGGASIAGVAVPTVYPCADGFVVASVAFGSAWGPMTNRLAAWAGQQGLLELPLASRDWSGFPGEVQSGQASPGELEALVAAITGLFASRSKDQIWTEARTRGLLVAPAMDTSDIARSPQFAERRLWNEFEWAGRTIRIPARFAQFSNYSIETRCPAPSLSQDTNDILAQELGLSAGDLQALFVHGVT